MSAWVDAETVRVTAPPSGGELHRVAQQVDQDLLGATIVREDHRGGVEGRGRELDLLVFCRRADHRQALLDHRAGNRLIPEVDPFHQAQRHAADLVVQHQFLEALFVKQKAGKTRNEAFFETDYPTL